MSAYTFLILPTKYTIYN